MQISSAFPAINSFEALNKGLHCIVVFFFLWRRQFVTALIFCRLWNYWKRSCCTSFCIWHQDNCRAIVVSRCLLVQTRPDFAICVIDVTVREVFIWFILDFIFRYRSTCVLVLFTPMLSVRLTLFVRAISAGTWFNCVPIYTIRRRRRRRIINRDLFVVAVRRVGYGVWHD